MGPRARVFKVKSLTAEGPARLQSEDAKGQRMSVADYFKNRYNRVLKLDSAPCLNVRTPCKPIYLPAEVCTIAPGQRRLKLDEKQTVAMIKSAAQKPDERAYNIGVAVNEKGCLAQLEGKRYPPLDAATGQLLATIGTYRRHFLKKNGIGYTQPDPSPDIPEGGVVTNGDLWYLFLLDRAARVVKFRAEAVSVNTSLNMTGAEAMVELQRIVPPLVRVHEIVEEAIEAHD